MQPSRYRLKGKYITFTVVNGFFFSVKSQEPKIKIEMTESVANKIENSINQHGLGFGLREAL